MSMEIETAPADPEALGWSNMTPTQLKAELSRLEALAKQMAESGLATGKGEIQERMASLKTYQRSKMPEGQQLLSLQASIRKAQSAAQKASLQIEDLKSKLAEQEDKLKAAKAEEATAQEALEKAKREIGQEEGRVTTAPAAEDLTTSSAKFAQALVPATLPEPIKQQLLIQINGLLSNVQAEVQKSVGMLQGSAAHAEEKAPGTPSVFAPAAGALEEKTPETQLDETQQTFGKSLPSSQARPNPYSPTQAAPIPHLRPTSAQQISGAPPAHPQEAWDAQ